MESIIGRMDSRSCGRGEEEGRGKGEGEKEGRRGKGERRGKERGRMSTYNYYYIIYTFILKIPPS